MGRRNESIGRLQRHGCGDDNQIPALISSSRNQVKKGDPKATRRGYNYGHRVYAPGLAQAPPAPFDGWLAGRRPKSRVRERLA